jgi:hypothetical protein
MFSTGMKEADFLAVNDSEQRSLILPLSLFTAHTAGFKAMLCFQASSMFIGKPSARALD